MSLYVHDSNSLYSTQKLDSPTLYTYSIIVLIKKIWI